MGLIHVRMDGTEASGEVENLAFDSIGTTSDSAGTASDFIGTASDVVKRIRPGVCRAWLSSGWSWRESNPRPNEEAICFLHAYPCIGFRAVAGAGQPTDALSSKCLTVGARPPQAIPDFPAPPCRRASGRELPGDVSSQHLVPRLSQ